MNRILTPPAALLLGVLLTIAPLADGRAQVPTAVGAPGSPHCQRTLRPGQLAGAAPAYRTTSAFRDFERLMNRYDVTSARLDLGLERTDNALRPGSNVLTRARNASTMVPLDTLGFELNDGLLIDSLLINGQRVSPLNWLRPGTATVRVFLPTPVAPGAAFTYQLYYHGAPSQTGGSFFGQGLTSAAAPQFGNRVTWTLSSPFATADWCPSKQVLADKLDSVRVLISTDTANKAGSNGRLVRTTPLPGGKVRYEWASRYPIAYYLVSATVSNYAEHLRYAHPAGLPAADSVPVLSYVYPGALTTFAAELEDTAPLLENYSARFGRYPFWQEKYGHCMAPIGGGMEHQTMTTIGGFEFTLTAHELFHQWFGDNVTCRSYRDIWLNEGFATYGEYVSLQDLRTATLARQWLSRTRGQAFATSGSVVVPATDDTLSVSRVFDGQSTYAKGGIVVHMLRHVVNDDSAFFAGLRAFQQQYAGRTATTTDLRRSLEASWGQPLEWFFDQWAYGEGYPRLTVRWNQIGDNLLIESAQTATTPATTAFFRMPIEFDYVPGSGRPAVTVRLEQTQPTQTWIVPLAPGDTARFLAVDPRLWNLLQVRRLTRDQNLVTGTGADRAPAARLVAYPNPCAEFLTLPAASAPRTAHVFDLTGRLLRTEPLAAGATCLPTATLPPGSYLLRLTEADGTTRLTRFARQ